jgi:hypothetical protein
MPLSAELSANDVTVAPGDTEVIRLTVRNLGTSAETVAFLASGMSGGWVQLAPSSASLFPNEHCDVAVRISPPRSPAIPAGASPLVIRVVPHGAPDDAITVEGVVHVLAFSERRVTVLQPVAQGNRRAEFDIVVENLGNTPASCRLTLSDPARKLTGRFEPPSVGVEPGRAVGSTLRVRALRRRWRGVTSSVPFEVTASQDGYSPATASATFLQTTVIRRGWWKPVVAVGVLGAVLVGAWFGVVRPFLDDAADRAVRDLAPTITPAPTVAPTTPPESVPPSTAPSATNPPTGSTPVGELFAFRLPVLAPVGNVGVADFDTPAGTRVEITDIVLQNPNGDLGQARLLRNDDVLLTWRLDNILGDDVKQYVSPYELRTGDRLTFEVTCSGAGDPAVGSCSTSVSVTGRLYRI